MSESGIPIAWREPFSMREPYVDVRPHGETVLEIIQSVPDLPERFMDHGVVHINGVEIARDKWRVIRPKPSLPEMPLALTMTMPLAGGGKNGVAKSVIGLVGAIALTIVTQGIAAGTILGTLTGTVGTSLGIGATAFGRIVAGVVGLAGAAALNALTSSSVSDGSSSNTSNDATESSSASGNVISPGGSISRIVGSRRVFPQLIGSPIIELVDDDEYVEVGFALNGPHMLQDLRIDGTSIADAEDVDYETREGWLDDELLTLTKRQGYLATPNIQLSTHTVDSENQDRLKNQSNPSSDLPVWHGITARKSPDEIWIHDPASAGIGISGASTDITIPIRIRIRLRGTTTWRNFPEIHLSGRSAGSIARRAILIKWTAEPESVPSVPTKNGYIYANKNVPAQTASPASGGWVSDAYFSGAGNDYLYNGVEASTGIKHTFIYYNRVDFYLNTTDFPNGIYEIQIKRGCSYDFSNFTNNTYAYGGTVYDFFGYFTSGGLAKIPYSQENVTDVLSISRIQSIWNSHPAPIPGFALVAVKALNRSVNNFSVLASGYVQDWDGSGWNTWTTTSNPAPHYRDVLSGLLNLDPLPDDIRDDDDLVAWRALCTSNGWACDAIIDDQRTQDVLSLLAAGGYASPYQSEVYGVTVDNDRTADSPTTIFSSNNTNNFRWEKAFSKLPDGLIVTYRDVNDDENDAQIIVYDPDYDGGDNGLLESVSYDGLVTEDTVRARATFDLMQASLRNTFYYFDTDLEAIVVRRGSLVGVNYDIIDMRGGQAIVQRVLLSADESHIIGLNLTSEIPISNELDMHGVANMHNVADMHAVGIVTGIAIRHSDGTTSTHALSNATGNSSSVIFATPIVDTPTILGVDDEQLRGGEVYACLIVSGRLTQEYSRMLVYAITFNKDLTASVTLVDEAPGLIRYHS